MQDMLRVQLVTQHEHDDPVQSMLSAAAYGLRATVHGTTLATPGQLVFNKDMILRSHMETNLELVRQRHTAAAIKNNERENKRRIAYNYKAGDWILIKALPPPHEPKMALNKGAFKVVAFNKANGTLTIERGRYTEPINV